MILDTGSDVIWPQCLPCRKCYIQIDPIFNPKKSMSFEAVKCGTPLCPRSDSKHCNKRNECLYKVEYSDGSFSSGELSTETLTFGNTKVPNITLGCGHDNEGLFINTTASLLGLGRSKLGFQFGKKFSYCWSASGNSSSLIFGESAVPKNSMFTPLLTNPKVNIFYYVELIGISVDGKPVPGINASLFKLDDSTGKGGVIVDSGTTITRLIHSAYLAPRNAFRAGASKLKRATNYYDLDTCFDLSGKTTVRVPTVVLHLNGADLSLPESNILIPVDSYGKFCFAFEGISDFSVIGNIQQEGFRVGFDLANNRVGFAPKGCT